MHLFNLFAQRQTRICWLLVILICSAHLGVTAGTLPVRSAHAHNDYEHPRPLKEALELGFVSVEADIHLVGDQLLVAHDREQVQDGRTLQKLYLDPLRELVRKQQGRVYLMVENEKRQALGRQFDFVLMIDIKSEANATYEVLREVLKDYTEWLTVFSPTSTTPRAITVLLSGNRPIEIMANESTRWCAVDGRLADLVTNPSVHLYPLISDSWRVVFGKLTCEQWQQEHREKLRELIARTHAQGRQFRLWGAPDEPFIWEEFRATGMDLIGTDRLAELARFLNQQSRSNSKP